jgi:HSP20 family protein
MELKFRYMAYKYMERAQTESPLMSLLDWFYHASIVHTEFWHPPTDVYETPDSLIIKIDIAGVEEDTIRVTLFDDFLVVEGKREESLSKNKIAYHQMGIRYGPFRAEVFLPVTIDKERVTAEYENGLLNIALPKF